MNKEQFYNLLSDNYLLSNFNEKEVDEIIKEFPYFQAAYIIKSKILQINKDIRFDNFIKTTALFSLDRKLLYEYINKTAVVLEKSLINNDEGKVEEKIIKSEKTKQEIQNIVKESIKRKIYYIKIKIHVKITNSTSQTETETKESDKFIKRDNILSAQKTIKTAKKTIADIILEKLKNKPKNEGESIADRILRKAKEIKKDSKSLVDKNKTDQKFNKELIEQKNEIKNKKIYFIKVKISKYKETNIKIVKTKCKPKKIYFIKIDINKIKNIKETATNKEIQADFDALAEINKVSEISSEIFVYDLEKETKIYEKESDKAEMSFSDWLNFVETRNKKIEKKDKFSLINKFINENPEIKIKQDNRQFENIEISNKAHKKNTILITETLANIYVKQKHYEQAISTFKKLSLKYPQKSIYFANRIKEVEKLIKK